MENDKRIKELENEKRILEISYQRGLPYELAKRVKGETDEEINKDISLLMKYQNEEGQESPTFSNEPSDSYQVNNKKVGMKKMIKNIFGDRT